jgi:hypothetical protein
MLHALKIREKWNIGALTSKQEKVIFERMYDEAPFHGLSKKSVKLSLKGTKRMR